MFAVSSRFQLLGSILDTRGTILLWHCYNPFILSHGDSTSPQTRLPTTMGVCVCVCVCVIPTRRKLYRLDKSKRTKYPLVGYVASTQPYSYIRLSI